MPLTAPTLTLVSKTATNIIVSVSSASGGTEPYQYSITIGSTSGDTDIGDSNIDGPGQVDLASDLSLSLTPGTTFYLTAWVDDAGAEDRIAGNEITVTTDAAAGTGANSLNLIGAARHRRRF